MDLAGSLFLSLFCHYSKHFYATQPEQLGVISSALKHQEAKAGDTSAMCQIAYMYRYGQGVEKNYETAMEWYKKAADAGNASAMVSLGEIYDYVMDDYQTAVEWYTKAGKFGDPEYRFWAIGAQYKNGFRVREDFHKALEWYTKAVEAGSISAMNSIGYMYEQEKKYDKAIEWYTKAAEAGDWKAMHDIGDLYNYKLHDYDKAIEWHTKAVDAGNDYSLYSLGSIYENKIHDTDKAIEWYTKAAEAGDELAKDHLERLKSN